MRTLLIIAAACALGGCTALMVGGGNPAAGSPQGSSPPAGAQAARDGATTANVRRRLAADSAVDATGIDVNAYAGRVTLSGRVGSYAERRRAGEIAAGVEGVQSVDNRLVVTDQ